MNILDCRTENDWICFKLADPREAIKAKFVFKAGNYDLIPHKEKRSNNANSYAWELMTRISMKLHVNVIDVYRNEIQGISGKSEIIWCPSPAVEDLRKAWVGDHIGRELKVIEDDGRNATLIAIYGSSDYDRSQMSELIEHIVEDCKSLGIETRDPKDIESLLERWN